MAGRFAGPSFESTAEQVGAICREAPLGVLTTLEGRTLKQRHVQEMARRYARRALIKKRITLHVLRHTLATDLCRETGKIDLLRKALGHAHLPTTMIYTHVHDEEIGAALRSLKTS